MRLFAESVGVYQGYIVSPFLLAQPISGRKETEGEVGGI